MPELSIIVPTYNERANLCPLLHCLQEALEGVDYEVLFVDDDSPDSTAAMARTIALSNPRVRVLQRIGRRGLASAAVEGMLATSSPYLLVMDADLQHDERIIPAMLAKMKQQDLDIVVGSRNTAGGSMGEFTTKRVALSNAGRSLSARICHVDIQDPMSGFFLVKREYFHKVVHDLSSVGFKILVDLLASAPGPVKFAEVPYTFRNRVYGESKLDIVVGIEYLQLLLDKWICGFIPVSYLLFAVVGSFGAIANLVLTTSFLEFFKLPFLQAQAIGAAITIAINFLLNNQITFRSARLKGVRLLQGLALFYVSCAVGLLAQVAIAGSLESVHVESMLATIAGIVVGSVWNYSMAFLFVWHVRRHRTKRLRYAYAEPAWIQQDSAPPITANSTAAHTST